nr:hypothetical protein [Candidatus Sigynarchaeota archaeon]
ALKRRFNFIYIPVIKDKKMEKEIVIRRTSDMLDKIGFDIQIPVDTLDLLVTVFQELRTGQSENGARFQPVQSVMSTSEEISNLFLSCLYAKFYGKDTVEPKHIAMNIYDSVVKDDKENIAKLKEYFNIAVSRRAVNSPKWKEFHETFNRLL